MSRGVIYGQEIFSTIGNNIQVITIIFTNCNNPIVKGSFIIFSFNNSREAGEREKNREKKREKKYPD